MALDEGEELATTVAELADQEPFLLAVNVALVAPRRGAKSRPVDNLVRRRFGFRLAPAARGTPPAPDATPTGDALLAALAAAGAPSLPYPDRDRRKSGLAEIHAGLVLKVLLWESSPAARAPNHPFRQELFRAYGAPSYRPVADRGTWMENWARIDVLLRALDAQTVSVHMGATCTIDIAVAALDAAGAARVETLANTIVMENRRVIVQEVDADRVVDLGLWRPPKVTGPVRVVEVEDFDRSACGGTHVRACGEIGPIVVRGWERYKGGVRVVGPALNDANSGGAPRTALPPR